MDIVPAVRRPVSGERGERPAPELLLVVQARERVRSTRGVESESAGGESDEDGMTEEQEAAVRYFLDCHESSRKPEGNALGRVIGRDRPIVNETVRWLLKRRIVSVPTSTRRLRGELREVYCWSKARVDVTLAESALAESRTLG